MKNLVKIGLIRLSKNWFYSLGCFLAFVITDWFITVHPIPQLTSYSNENIAILVSAAIVVYFSIFVGLFIGNEYEDGILRNKVMAGHTQVEVYVSHYITLLFALIIMMCFWFLGTIASGTLISLKLMGYCLVAFLYNAAYIAILQAIVFNLKKQTTGILISVGIVYCMISFVLFGNFFYMTFYEQPVISKVIAVIYNMSAMGQCFASTALADSGLGNIRIQIPVSLILIALASFFGTLRLAKRDII